MDIDHNLDIPVNNKIDMPNAMPEEVEDEIVDWLVVILKILLESEHRWRRFWDTSSEAIIKRIPSPKGINAPLQALSWLYFQLLPWYYYSFARHGVKERR